VKASLSTTRFTVGQEQKNPPNHPFHCWARAGMSPPTTRFTVGLEQEGRRRLPTIPPGYPGRYTQGVYTASQDHIYASSQPPCVQPVLAGTNVAERGGGFYTFSWSINSEQASPTKVVLSHLRNKPFSQGKRV